MKVIYQARFNRKVHFIDEEQWGKLGKMGEA